MIKVQKLKDKSLRKENEFVKYYVEIYPKSDYCSYTVQTEFCDTYRKAIYLRKKITYTDPIFGVRIMVAYGKSEEEYDIDVFEILR